jgi:hypothetical protein
VLLWGLHLCILLVSASANRIVYLSNYIYDTYPALFSDVAFAMARVDFIPAERAQIDPVKEINMSKHAMYHKENTDKHKTTDGHK